MSGPVTAVPLLERDAEMTALHTAVLAARAGNGSVVLVTGEAGLGKSSLVRSGQTRALAGGARVLEAACDDLVASRVLGAIRDLGQTSAGPLRAALWLGPALAGPAEVVRRSGRRCPPCGSAGVECAGAGGDPVALAWGRSTAAQLAMISSRYQEASRFAQQAISVARDHGDTALLVHALNNDGVAQWLVHGREGGAPLLAESLKGALEHGLEDDACRAYVNWVGCLLDDCSYTEADQLAVEGIAYADRCEQLSSMRFLQSERALGLLCTGRWTEAVTQAQLALAGPPDASTVSALAVIGSVRVRRGDESAQEVLDAAAAAARFASSPQRLIPVAAARAEHAWLAGRPQDIPEAIKLAMASAIATDHEWSVAEMAYWSWRAGAAGPALTGDNPFVLEMNGRPNAAASGWQALGRPYEQARALSEAGGADDLRVAATLADRLGAEPLGRRIRTAMRAAECLASQPSPSIATPSGSPIVSGRLQRCSRRA